METQGADAPRSPWRKFLDRLLPDRRRRQRAWLLLRKAIAIWLNLERGTIWLHCDAPELTGPEPLLLSGVEEFRGWALAAKEVTSISFYCDNIYVGDALRGLPRPDVAPFAIHLRKCLRSGFQFLLDTRQLPLGVHELRITAKAADGQVAHVSGTINVDNAPEAYQTWLKQTRPSPAALAWMRRTIPLLAFRPVISILLRAVEAPDPEALAKTMASLQAQVYTDWKLALGWSKELDAPMNGRFTGELFGILEPGDVLEPHALFEAVYYFNLHDDADLVYSDEDTLFPSWERGHPRFKPEWSDDPLRAALELGRFWLGRSHLLDLVDGGNLLESVREANLLRACAEKPVIACHLRDVLCSGSSAAHAVVKPPVGPHSFSLEPTVLTFAPFPMLPAGAIRNILVVKLDHLGDVFLAFPAIRRLRELFPKAKITALVGSWARGLAEREPALDQVLTWDFFDASSSEAAPELTPEAERQIQALLAPFGFDLAIDLRREPETRTFVRLSGAPYTVGFANEDDDDWLTVALPYTLLVQRRWPRLHVVQELLHLVEMVSVACREGVRPEMHVTAAVQSEVDALMCARRPTEARCLVGIHPGAGRDIKCWPAAHFARLADLICERLQAGIVLFGAASDKALVESILSQMRWRSRAFSLAGLISLEGFQAALGHLDLFVGNDSGPAHLAGAAGLPTVSVCSGTIDPIQWAPLGPSAVSIHRRMLCSPCYLRERAECAYGVACLQDLTVEEVWDACLRMLVPRWHDLLVRQ